MQYFIIENQVQAGPFTIDQLKGKNISAETLVWADGMQDWTPAWKVDELKDIIGDGPTTASSTPPPYTPPTPNNVNPQNANGVDNNLNGDQNPLDDKEAENQKKKDRKKMYIIAAVVVFFLMMLSTCTNPDRQSHEDAIKQELNSAFNKASDMGDNSIISDVFSKISKMITGNLLDSAIDNILEYHSYMFFSKCTVNYKGDDHTVSYGFMGHVWTANADDIYKAISTNNSLLNNNSSDTDDESVNDNEETDNNHNDADADRDDNQSVKQHIENKADEAVNKITNRVSDHVNNKIDEKIDELSSDSTAIDKLISKIMKLL